MSRPVIYAELILSLVLAGLLGCQRTAQQSDAATARETLHQSLAAWKKGDSLESLQKASPPLTVVDRQWQQGVRLLDYQLEGDGEPNGFDVQIPVKLSLQDRAGKKFKEKAAYNVSTSPALVIVRAEGPG